MNRLIQNLFIVLAILLTSGCGSSKSKKAQAKIVNFTTSHSEKPTIEDYNTAGFSNINESNINRVNDLLIEMPVEDVDTFVEIKVVIEELLDNKIPPTIIIVGENPLTLKIDLIYKELGAVASDDRDGNITENIKIVSNINTSKKGVYTVSYSVEDSAGNKVTTARQINVVLDTGNMMPSEDDDTPIVIIPSKPTIPEDNNDVRKIIEDAEDGKTSHWRIEYDHSNKAEINNIYDDEKGSRVIFLDGNERTTGFIFHKTLNETESKYIQWQMKTNEKFVVRIIVDTLKGERYLEYYPKDTGKGEYSYNNKHYIRHGIGSTSVDGKWHTYIRDIKYDVKRYEKDNELKFIKGIFFRGKLKVDNIIFHRTAKNIKVDLPVTVSAPGVVLTFDDSFIDSWSKVMTIFQERDVVATFFCHRWGSVERGDITEKEVALLKSFEGYGHEIGYHTVDHMSTRDIKYKIYNTIEEKAKAYLDEQIKPGVNNMRERGFNPSSFSYPYITGQPEHNKIIRETLPHIREFFAHVYVMDEKPAGGSKTLEDIKLYLDKFKKDKEIGVLLGHWILEKKEFISDRHAYRTSVEKLIQIIDYAQEIGLKFYTLEEAHRIYVH